MMKLQQFQERTKCEETRLMPDHTSKHSRRLCINLSYGNDRQHRFDLFAPVFLTNSNDFGLIFTALSRIYVVFFYLTVQTRTRSRALLQRQLAHLLAAFGVVVNGVWPQHTVVFLPRLLALDLDVERTRYLRQRRIGSKKVLKFM